MSWERASLERCVEIAVTRTRDEPGPLLEILHSVQNELAGDLPSLVASGLFASSLEEPNSPPIGSARDLRDCSA